VIRDCRDCVHDLPLDQPSAQGRHCNALTTGAGCKDSIRGWIRSTVFHANGAPRRGRRQTQTQDCPGWSPNERGPRRDSAATLITTIETTGDRDD